MALEDSGFDAPYPDAVGLRTLDPADGVVELTFGDYTRNSAGILHGGVVGALSLRAAEEASGGSAGWRAVEAHFHYLAPGRVGPFRTHAEPLADHPGRRVARRADRHRGRPDDDGRHGHHGARHGMR
ncbi:MAG: thioesterase family protein [Acidimicrobiia bacterium]|nr:thioesterase family protein [Acidimicrobiia bacterium]